MAKTEDQIVARLPVALIERLDRMAERMAREPSIAATAGPRGVTRSAALRLALLEGLAVLDARYPARKVR